MANRLRARVASQVFLTYPATADRLPGTAPREVVGCPVQPTVLTGDGAAACERYGLSADRTTVLVVGGSLGARAINQLGIALARSPQRSFQLLHVTGPKYIEEVRSELGPVPEGVVLIGYEDRMPDTLAASQLVLARAGSSTLAELTVVGLPSVLVPSPNVTDNHQEDNARGLEVAGAAKMLLEHDLDVDAAVADIIALANDATTLSKMSEAARLLGRPDTAERVADIVERWLADA